MRCTSWPVPLHWQI